MKKKFFPKFSYRSWFVVFCLQIICFLMIFSEHQKIPSKNFEISFFDVQLGDAIFIKSPNGHNIIIDGGTDSAIIEKIMRNKSFFDRKIDAIILTHPDSDHLFGAYYALDNFKVNKVFITGVKTNNKIFYDFLKLAKNKNTELVFLDGSQDFKTKNIYFNVLLPIESIKNKEINNTNNTSIVLRVNVFNKNILLTGDIEKKIEKLLTLSDEKLKSDLLKLSHHGSSSSSDPDFISTVNPKFAIITASEDNPYYHPHKKTLNTLKNFDVQFWQTGLSGDIKYSISPNSFYEFNFTK